MQNEVKKITRLVDEVTSLLMRSGSNDEISSLNDVLNIQRQCEVEEFYWELMGDDSHEDELFLVGSMVDKATVNKIDKDLHIVMYRCLTKCKK